MTPGFTDEAGVHRMDSSPLAGCMHQSREAVCGLFPKRHLEIKVHLFGANHGRPQALPTGRSNRRRFNIARPPSRRPDGRPRPGRRADVPGVKQIQISQRGADSSRLIDDDGKRGPVGLWCVVSGFTGRMGASGCDSNRRRLSFAPMSRPGGVGKTPAEAPRPRPSPALSRSQTLSHPSGFNA